MKASGIHEYGGPEVLVYEDYPDAVAGPGEVLVRVAAAGINPVDTFERAGANKDWNPFTFPAIIGWDVSGTVVALGTGVTSFVVGDRVCGWAGKTYAELCAVKADLLAKIPEGLDVVDAAAYPLGALTGGELISVAGGIQAGQSVLVSGSFGGVGRSAIFVAKDRGGVVTAGVRKSEIEAAKSLGADHVLALDDPAAMDALQPFDMVANAVRGKTAEQLIAKVKPGGMFVSVTGAPENAQEFPSVRVVAFVSKQDNKFLSYMLGGVKVGKLLIPIDRKLPLKEAREGHIAVEKGGAGKIVLVP
jgi:NADPH:quinone reductase-like Zn-dependent oxidoreductase